MINKYYDTDCNLALIKDKTIAVIGFGSQGHAHSMNLAESGCNVVVGLRQGSGHWAKAAAFAEKNPNFKVMEVEDAAKVADIVMMLVPDELAADIYEYGITVAGGCALLGGIAPMIASRTGLRVNISKAPLDAVCLGIERVIESDGEMENVIRYRSR